LGLLPYRRRLFGRCDNLRRKKAARASEVRTLARYASCGFSHLAAGQQKQSINHAGKEANTLRYGPASALLLFPEGASPAFAPRSGRNFGCVDPHGHAVWPQAVEKDGKAKRGAEASEKNERPGPEGAGPGPF
jgi:hypothetical protein